MLIKLRKLKELYRVAVSHKYGQPTNEQLSTVTVGHILELILAFNALSFVECSTRGAYEDMRL